MRNSQEKYRRTKGDIVARLITAFLRSLLCALVVTSPVLAAASASQEAPATQTELSQQAISLKIDVYTPSAGVASNIGDLLRDPAFAKQIDNLHMIKRGVWSTRGTGWAKHVNTQYNSGATILEVYPYTDSSNVAKVLFRAGSKYYDYNIGTTTATEIGSGFTSSDIPSIRVYGRPTYAGPINAYFADGAHELQKWTGSGTMSAVGPFTVAGRTFTKPKFLEEFGARQILSGYSDYSSAILITDTSSYESFAISSPQAATDGGWIDVPKGLGPVTGLKTVRISDTENVCLIGCTNGVAILTGSDATDFRVKEVTREFGIPSNRTWITIQNDTYFMANDGIRRYTTNSISGLLNSRKTYLIQDLINRQNTSYASKAFAFYHAATQEAQFWFPIDSDTTPKNAIVLNFNTANPTAAGDEDTRPIFSTKSGITIPCGVENAGIAWAGTTDGYLMNLYSGDTYNGSAINWTFVTPMFGANSPAQSMSMQKSIIMTDGGDQKFTCAAYTLSTLSDGNTKLIAQDSRDISVTAASVTNLGTWASGTTTTYPKLIDFQSKGVGRFWCLKLYGDATDEHIDLSGVQAIMTVGGWRQ